MIDGTDVATGYGLVNGRRSVYILVTKRADASTLAVVSEVKRNIPDMQQAISRFVEVDTVSAASELAKASQSLEVSKAVSAHIVALLNPSA